MVVEKPFGNDLKSARQLAAELHRVPRRVPDLPDRPLPREDGARGDPLSAVREHDDRAGVEPELPRVRADHDGRELRRRGSRQLLRSGRRAPRRGRQPPDAGRWRPRRWSRRPAGTPTRSRKPSRPCSARCATAEPSHYVRGQYDGYTRHRRGRRRLDHRDLRRASARHRQLALGRASRSSSGPASGSPVSQTELRVVFKQPPRRSTSPSEPSHHPARRRVSWCSRSTRQPGCDG